MIPDESEKDFQKTVIDLARKCGWRVAHFRPARTKHGWRTAVSADGAGFFDLVLVRDRIIFAEIKREKGKTSSEQDAWAAATRKAGGEVYLWRPSDWDEIVDTLTRRVPQGTGEEE